VDLAEAEPPSASAPTAEAGGVGRLEAERESARVSARARVARRAVSGDITVSSVRVRDLMPAASVSFSPLSCWSRCKVGGGTGGKG